MDQKNRPKKSAQKSARSATGSGKTSQGFSAEERAAVRARSRELKTDLEDGENAVLTSIAEMAESDRIMAERLHVLVKASAPALTPKTWYGMPAYYKDGKLICFYQSAQKFKTRYPTFGFSDKAHLDDGDLWPVAFALNKLTPAVEARIADLVKRAVS